MSIDIEQIRKRAEAATPGPWIVGDESPYRSHDRVVACDGGKGDITDYIEGPDAEFIAHAREDVPALLDEVERLRAAGSEVVVRLNEAEAERDRLRAAVDAVRAHLGGLLDEWEREGPEEWAAVHPTVYGAIDAARYSVLSDFRAALAALDEHLKEGRWASVKP